MIWHYFPIGFRFPVKDFSDETKRACWEIALSALYAGDPKGMTLYDAQELYDYGSNGPVYQCIACSYGIKQSRAMGKLLYSLDRLMPHLCSHTPFMQANALESFGPFAELGKIDDAGVLCPEEAGAALFNGLLFEPMAQNDGMRLLIVSDAQNAETCTRMLGIAAADLGLRVQRMQLSDGGLNLVRALVTERNGRYETVAFTNADGERQTETIGILPHGIAILETAGKDKETVNLLLEKVHDLGYRDIRLGTSLEEDAEPAEQVPHLLQPEFESAAKQADFVLLHAKNGTAQAALNELNTLRKPTSLLAREAIDAQRVLEAYPVLRGVSEATDASITLNDVFCSRVLPLIGKDVAKTQGL